jgi:hypothetical protein
VSERPVAPDEAAGSATAAMKEDLEHLRLLATFHYVVAALAGLFALFPILHLAIGLAAVTGHLSNGRGGDPFPALFGWFFIGFSAVWMTLGFTFAISVLFAARCLAHRRRYQYCLVMACVECMFMPVGTVLGVFAILVLQRPAVKDLFGQAHP